MGEVSSVGLNTTITQGQGVETCPLIGAYNMSNDEIMIEYIQLLLEIDGRAPKMTNEALKRSAIAPMIVLLLEQNGITFENIALQDVVINGVIVARHGTKLTLTEGQAETLLHL